MSSVPAFTGGVTTKPTSDWPSYATLVSPNRQPDAKTRRAMARRAVSLSLLK